jgi:hypothetical protein
MLRKKRRGNRVKCLVKTTKDRKRTEGKARNTEQGQWSEIVTEAR